jgi:tRNA threonylcarbamoyl adenosine modification protein YeaZ
MIILTIRTDKPEAEIGLYKDAEQIAYVTWQAHRALAETLHGRIRDMLTGQNLDLKDIECIVCLKGPGSFTGLRIGLTVANALSYSLSIPIVGTTGDDWIQIGIKRLLETGSEKIIMPEYGADVHITLPKH